MKKLLLLTILGAGIASLAQDATRQVTLAWDTNDPSESVTNYVLVLTSNLTGNTNRATSTGTNTLFTIQGLPQESMTARCFALSALGISAPATCNVPRGLSAPSNLRVK